jgi:hypothetical protein
MNTVMRRLRLVMLALTSIAFWPAVSVYGQQPQIPTLQVCNISGINGSGLVKIKSRSDAQHSGTFAIGIDSNNPVKCAPPGYPTGSIVLKIDMSDSIVNGQVTLVSIEQITVTGKHTPTAYLNGRCKAENAPGCRFWLSITDNGKLPENQDVVGFLIMDGNGKRVAYGTGPLVKDDLVVQPTSN